MSGTWLDQVPVDERIASRFRGLTVPCALFVITVGLLGWIGALLDADRLRSALGGENSQMTVATCSYLIALAVATVLVAHGSARSIRASRILALLVFSLALGALAEHALAVDLGIDLAINEEPGVDYPGRPEPETAIQFAIGAIWLFFYGSTHPLGSRVAKTAMALISVFALISLYAYAFAGSYAWDDEGVRRIALQGLVAFILLVVGAAALNPERWWMRPFVLSGAVGAACRRVLPAAVLAPLVAGFAFQVATGERDYSLTLELAVIVLAQTLVLTGAGLTAARALGQLETDRNRLEAELRRMADYDALTGTLSRRRFQHEIERLWRRTVRYEGTAAVLMIDLDGFKEINDTYGHTAGDEVLKNVGKVLIDRVRASDSVGRLGGDEFGVALERVDQRQAENVASDITHLLAAAEVLAVHPDVRVTASVGVGMIGSQTASADEAVVSADREMYAVKAEHKRSGTSADEMD